MKKLSLIPNNDERLHISCEVINPRYEPDLKKIIDQMFEIMMEHNGMGLAAPQVGILKRFFIMQWKNKPYICINPSIKKHGIDIVVDKEGCLSYPGLSLNVARSKEIKVSYQKLSGRRTEKKLRGTLARCFAHECDHLNGIVFTKRI